jgi:predicted transcriptional regulator
MKEKKPKLENGLPTKSIPPTAYLSLLKYVEERGITMQHFAEENGFNNCTISKWANGHRSPRLDKAQRLEKLTNGRVKAIDWD